MNDYNERKERGKTIEKEDYMWKDGRTGLGIRSLYFWSRVFSLRVTH